MGPFPIWSVPADNRVQPHIYTNTYRNDKCQGKKKKTVLNGVSERWWEGPASVR